MLWLYRTAVGESGNGRTLLPRFSGHYDPRHGERLDLLRQELGIYHIHTCIGGSVGGEQALEWAIIQPGLIDNLILIAVSAVASPWCIAFNESQRMAMKPTPPGTTGATMRALRV